MKTMKRLWSVVLAVCMLFNYGAVMNVNAETAATMDVSEETGYAGKTVEVTVELSNNPGVISVLLEVQYNASVLTLTEVSDGGILGTAMHSDNLTLNPYVLSWANDTIASDITANGTMVTLTFAVAENAPLGEYPITLVPETAEFYNYDVDFVDFNLVGGSVTVECAHEQKVEVPEKAPFCLETGNHRYYICSCGAVLKSDGVTKTTVEAETIPQLGHDWNDATCTAAKTCQRPNCGATEGTSLGHLWTEKIEDAAHLRQEAANCTQFDTYWFDCARCDAISSTEYFTSQKAGPHIFTEKIEDAAHLVAGTGLNCQDAKEYYYDCAFCSQMGQESFVSDTMGEHMVSTQWTTQNGQHFHACTVDGCDYAEDLAACAGGKADCLNKAVCADCKQPYGDLGDHDLTHHARNEADHTKPGNIEYWTCGLCGKYFADNGAKTEITETDTVIAQIPHNHSNSWSSNASQHWNECSCGDKINVFDHQYDNTCDTTCNTCGYERTITHSWESTLSYDANQHWIECSVCGEKKDVQTHNGGKADCLNKAVCADCSQPYGDLGDHDLTRHARNEADHTKPGNIEYWTCDLCGKYFADENGKTEITEKDTVIAQIPHSHSDAWSSNAAQHWHECSCGDKADVGDHQYDNTCDTTCNTCGYERTITHSWKSTLSYDANQHWTECSVCGEKKNVQTHNGGKADCLNKAVCADCNQPYGDLGNHDLTHHAGNSADHTKPGNIEYWTCGICGKYYSDASAKNEITEKDTVIPQIPHSHSSQWSSNASQHWNECSCGDKINVFAHQFDNTCDTTCNTCGYERTITHSWKSALSYDANQHWTECAVCGEKKDVQTHSGGKATCLEKAKCDDCGQAYGELASCDLTAKNTDSKYLKHEATCTDAAVYYYSCSVCGKASTETFSYGQPDGQNHVGGTELRGAKPASCTEDGYTGDTYCKGCGDKLQTGEKIPGGHKLSVVPPQEATHEQSGNREHYACAVCGKLYADDKGTTELNPEDVIIPKGEHAYGDWCHNDSKHWKECECGSKTEEGKHTFGAWVTTQEAAVGVDGSKERQCSECGYKEIKEIPAPSTPPTGDGTQTQLLMAVFALSALGLVYLCLVMLRKKREY